MPACLFVMKGLVRESAGDAATLTEAPGASTVPLQGGRRMDRKHLAAPCTAAMLVWLVLGIPAHGTPQASQKKQEGAVVRGNIRNWSSTPGIQGLERAFEYLARTDLAALPLGRTDIEGDDVYVLLSEGETRPPEQVQFEAHRRYIDIQLVVRGQEAIGVAPAAALTTITRYDAAKDIEFFAVPRESATLEISSCSRPAMPTGPASTWTARTSRARPSSRSAWPSGTGSARRRTGSGLALKRTVLPPTAPGTAARRRCTARRSASGCPDTARGRRSHPHPCSSSG